MVDPTWTETCPACGYERASVNQMGQMYGHAGVTGCPHSGSRFDPVRSGVYPLKYDVRPAITATLAYKEDGLAATIRYDWEYADHIEEGEFVSLRDRQGDPFGIGRVAVLHRGTTSDVLKSVWDGDARYPIGSSDELLSTLNHYYEDAITLSTEVLAVEYAPTITGFGP